MADLRPSSVLIIVTFFHAFADIPMDKGSFSEHQIEFTIKSGPSFRTRLETRRYWWLQLKNKSTEKKRKKCIYMAVVFERQQTARST